MRASENDTIAAVATPFGEGGIAVLRLSGVDAVAIAEKGFRGAGQLLHAQTHTAHVGKFVSVDGDVIDEVVATVFREPRSYTGENVVEISCHGGILITRRILQSLVDFGARLAEPGEFTKRAFLNGKLDLSQAEAVADLIHAGSDLARRSSLDQLKGRLSERVNQERNQLIEIVGLLELELDFVEDQLEFIDKQKIVGQLESILERLHALADSYRTGRVVREGVKAVLVGSPNVGKSSILNSLLNNNRAIVTEMPGTTRDLIEESLSIDGLLFRVVDTAGLRETDDPVEREGVRRTESQIENSDLIILVLDASRRPVAKEIDRFQKITAKAKESRQSALIVLNKIDLPRMANGELLESAPELRGLSLIEISALTGQGMDGLKKQMVQAALAGGEVAPDKSVTVTNTRHHVAILQASRSLELALKSLREGRSGELVALDLRIGLDRLGEITGAVTTDDILNGIFSKFCIGK